MILLAIIEGLTEFLPVSSTGHLIIGSSLMGIGQEDFTKMFIVCIQFGAILSVVVLYARKFVNSFNFYLKLFVAFLPAVILGKLFHRQIDFLLGNVLVVAGSLFAGGVVFLFVDRWFDESRPLEEISCQSALKIGLFQVIAMIPGVSRSGATIIGGLSQRLTRKAAAEFSFFLAVPTMFAATCYKLYEFLKEGHLIGREQLHLLLLGNVVAFLVAMAAIRSFIGFLNRHGFRVFGYYRIALGLAILALHFSGLRLHIL